MQTNSSEITPQKSDLRKRMKQPNFGSNVPKCIDVVKLFITAERVSDWRLHFFAVEKMMDLFATTGHIHYARSA